MQRDEKRRRRVARRRDLRIRLIEHAHFVGKLSLALKTWYIEVSFRPGHSGAAATALHFSSIAEKGEEADETHHDASYDGISWTEHANLCIRTRDMF